MDDSPASRLKKARERAGFATATDAARRFGWPISTYLSHENGQRMFKPYAARTYAKAFSVSRAWLLTGEGDIQRITAQVVGHLFQGRYIGFSGRSLEEVPAPSGKEGPWEAIHVGRGVDGFREDDYLLFVARPHPLPELVGMECMVVTLSPKVARYVCIPLPGAAPGEYTLYAPLMEPISALVTWAAPIDWILRPTIAIAPSGAPRISKRIDDIVVKDDPGQT